LGEPNRILDLNSLGGLFATALLKVPVLYPLRIASARMSSGRNILDWVLTGAVAEFDGSAGKDFARDGIGQWNGSR